MRERKFAVGSECKKLLEAAVEKKLPVTVTCRGSVCDIIGFGGEATERSGDTGGADNWQVYKSNFLALHGNKIVLAKPSPHLSDEPLELVPGAEISIAFKKGYNKCLFTTRIIGPQQFEFDSDESLPYSISSLIASDADNTSQDVSVVPAVAVYCPEHIEKFRRRAYNRTAPPSGLAVPVTFWSPVESGGEYQAVLANISAGGIGLAVPPDEYTQLEENAQYELKFNPMPSDMYSASDMPAGRGQEIQLSARFRHATRMPDGLLLLGFQLIGLELTEQGRSTLRRLGRIVSLYERQQPLCCHSNLSK
ncbi:MAG: PilZ domain-containing protein [Sedimentisphaerales bacterium]|nr:PilZ domain-containing protein [Sedimentisphaerales bacterium]